ncbi:hypothetical protein TorRG33x02_334930 [Trema orientale]|uniref:Uncharacterized protein n=1 Tax=Trema orientale TaxID=63057 RepID=A0A2P5B1Z8_TREOI|nr:hypothetical protein TorRG33x02_334930 [Trema orientale]
MGWSMDAPHAGGSSLAKLDAYASSGGFNHYLLQGQANDYSSAGSYDLNNAHSNPASSGTRNARWMPYYHNGRNQSTVKPHFNSASMTTQQPSTSRDPLFGDNGTRTTMFDGSFNPGCCCCRARFFPTQSGIYAFPNAQLGYPFPGAHHLAHIPPFKPYIPPASPGFDSYIKQLERYELNRDGLFLKLERVVKVNWSANGVYYFTLDVSGGIGQFYEAKFMFRTADRSVLFFCRPALYYPLDA